MAALVLAEVCAVRVPLVVCVCARSLPRRPTALAFTKCGNYVIIADKAGDVHRFSVSPDSELSESHTVSSSLLLGHVSMLLDIVGTFCHINFTMFVLTICVIRLSLFFGLQ